MIIKIARTDKELSANAGLVIFKQLVDSLGLDQLLSESIPTLKKGSAKNLKKFRQLLLAFETGADCLDDLEKLSHDEAFRAVCGGKVYSPKAYGDFLRSFSEMHCKNLNHKLIQTAYSLRQDGLAAFLTLWNPMTS